MFRIIGAYRDHSKIALDPVKASRRSRVLDAVLRSALPRPKRSVCRGTFEVCARMDAARKVEAPRRKRVRTPDSR